MSLDHDSPISLYQQLILVLERKIASGEWPPGSVIPPESVLTREYEISRTTVREAIETMVQEGKVYRKRGLGTFVALPRFAEPLAHLTGFVEELSLRGYQPAVRVLSYRVVNPPAEVVSALEVGAGDGVLHIRRLVSLAQRPLFVDDSYFPRELASLLAEDKIQTEPIYQILAASGRVPTKGDQWLEAVRISAEVAGLLKCEAETPGLAVTRVTQDHLGTPIEFTAVIYQGERYRYAIRLGRGQSPVLQFQ